MAAGLDSVDRAIFVALTTILASGPFNTTVRDAQTLHALCLAGTGTPSLYLPVSVAPATTRP